LTHARAQEATMNKVIVAVVVMALGFVPDYGNKPNQRQCMSNILIDSHVKKQ
jgi:hypothetical protein